MIDERYYRRFVSAIKGSGSDELKCLNEIGFGPCYADPCVIEIAVAGAPVRFSFKYKKIFRSAASTLGRTQRATVMIILAQRSVSNQK